MNTEMPKILSEALKNHGGTFEDFQIFFDLYGPYVAAKLTNSLVNNSGEELAIAFMSFYNTNVVQRY